MGALVQEHVEAKGFDAIQGNVQSEGYVSEERQGGGISGALLPAGERGVFLRGGEDVHVKVCR